MPDGDGEDLSFSFTAPMTASYAFSTFGSDFDTLLAAYDGCDGTELACNDEAIVSIQSKVLLDLEAGETVILVGGWIFRRDRRRHDQCRATRDLR